jgi:hypothetical protein
VHHNCASGSLMTIEDDVSRGGMYIITTKKQAQLLEAGFKPTWLNHGSAYILCTVLLHEEECTEAFKQAQHLN